jgi:ribosome assembly protein RRB1
MAKRAADDGEQSSPGALKDGDRPIADGGVPVDEQFEDEFEDEFESEDEILEAGVDGRPDEEREAEEQANGNPTTSVFSCFVLNANMDQVPWM